MINRRRCFICLSLIFATLTLIFSVSVLSYSIYKNKRKSFMIETKIQKPRATCLFICSSPTSFVNGLQEEGLRSVLMPNEINLDVEPYVDDEYSFPNMETHLYGKLKEKVKGGNYDAVIVSGSKSCEFVEKFRFELFPDSPVVFFNLENNDKARVLFDKGNFYGFLDDDYLDDTFSIARSIYPDVRKFIAIYDNTSRSLHNWELFSNLSNSTKGFVFRGVNTSLISFEKFKSMLSRIDDGSLIFYLGACTDNIGNKYSVNDIIDTIVNNTKSPVFTHNADGLGHGVIGGKTIAHRKAGVKAAEYVLKIISGVNENLISLDKANFGEFYFDYKAIKYRNLDSSKFPQNMTILNMDKTIFGGYRSFAISGIGIIASILMFLIVALYLIMKEKAYTKSLVESRSKLEFMAEHDYLTKLPNRLRVQLAFKDMVARHKKYSVILFDIDDFKGINDTYSHNCGDEVLRLVSSNILNLMADKNFYGARFGGDEFLVLYSRGHLSDYPEDLEKVKKAATGFVMNGGKRIAVHSSMGIANSLDRKMLLDDLVANADVAMYASKKGGKNRATFYNEAIKNEIGERKKILDALEDAIKNDGINVLYQPQINAFSGKIYGFEALMRLKNISLSPSEFIPVAEESGLMSTIGRILAEKVVQQLYEWRAHGLPLYKVSMNYSYAQMTDLDYVDYLGNLLEKYGIEPEYVGIEVTESFLSTGKENAKNLFSSFVKKGISLALDDFGTCYSSLNYLSHIPVDTVKIDKSLVDNYLSNDKEAFIQNIVNLIHSLEKKLTVEGVEYEWQKDKLKEFNCDYIQGYYYSRPISGTEVEAYTRKYA